MRRLEYSLRRDGVELSRTYDWIQAKSWIDMDEERNSYVAEMKEKKIISKKEEETKEKHRKKVAAVAGWVD